MGTIYGAGVVFDIAWRVKKKIETPSLAMAGRDVLIQDDRTKLWDT
jgi:hypothetical protein